MRRAAGLVPVLAAAAIVTGALAQTAPRPIPPVEPRFELGARGRSPFPSDHLTVADPGQRTGLRVALPLPNCALERSACDDVHLLNELDGFDLDPRLAVPFTGPIDPSTVGPRSVFLVRLAAGPPEATPVDRLVYDRDTHTLYARPETLLEPETRYGLVVTRELRDTSGRPIRTSGAFRGFLQRRDGPPALVGQRRALGRLMAVLGRRGIRADDVAVASVFTTGSVSTFLEQARDALDRRPPSPALMTTVAEHGGRAYFPRGTLSHLVWRQQVRAAADAPDALRDAKLPLAALPAEAIGGLGVGWYWSPWYLSRERHIAEAPTARPPRSAPSELPIPFVVILPAGDPPPGGWPVAIMGHGYGGEMFGSALRIAGTLARRGIATAAVTVVGHGGGPESRLAVTRTDGESLVIRVRGRGIDQDGDGRIENDEGARTPETGPLTSLGLRDTLRQQVVDLMALVRALRGGLDVDGDGRPDTSPTAFYYVGQSLGGIYGTLFLAVEPRVTAGVLTVPGGPIVEIARLSPVFRPQLRAVLGRRVPSLVNLGDEFREDLPLRGEPPVVAPTPGALALQDALARLAWLQRRGDPIAYARYLRATPLAGQEPKPVLVQFAWGDRVVPNPTTSALVRAGQLQTWTSFVRHDRLTATIPREFAEPHGFLLRTGAPGVVGTLAQAAQEQVARFFLAGGATVWDPDDAEPVFEVPAGELPERLGFARDPE